MLSADELIAYASTSMDTCATEELQHRLSLYQVFLKLYEQNRGLLDEILGLENSSSKSFAGAPLPYIQGVILDNGVHLTTNLLQGKTQALFQPQQIWIVGREPHKNSIAIQDSRLSRCHAAIQYIAPKGFCLVDLDSRNGSFINGERIWRSTLLKDGDRVRLGSFSFVFFLCQTAQTLQPVAPEMLTQHKVKQPLNHGDRPHLEDRHADRHPTGQFSQASEDSSASAKSLQGTFTFHIP